jgi:hypothetical protein
MSAQLSQTLPGLVFRSVKYDAVGRRLWIGRQRCHHGAIGALATTLACVELISNRHRAAPVLAAGGALLMAHDWKDRTLWFAPGPQNQS